MATDMSIEVARFLRENRDQIAEYDNGWYIEHYPWSKNGSTDRCYAISWAGSEIDEIASVLEGKPVDSRRWVHYGGDIIISRSREFKGIASYVEGRYHWGDVLAPLIWKHFAGGATEASAAFDALEAVLLNMINQNLATFETERLVLGALVRTWDFDLPNDMSDANPAEIPNTTRSTETDTTKSRVEDALTKRESDLVRLVVRGMTNGEIAAELGISLSTVKNSLGRVYSKLDVGNRAELVALVLSPEQNPPRD